jgi:integrase
MELTIAKMFCNWAVCSGLLRQSPFARVRPVGRPRRGKLQLRIDEARAFETAALRRFTERGDGLSLAALTALHLGLRASEALALSVRDLDDEGWMLWVEGTKTERARRHLEVPAVLQPHLCKAALGRHGDDFLFGESRRGGPRCRRLLHERVVALCKQARVTRVCPHSLRGVWATLQTRAGADPNAIAASLGHRSFEVTRRHYAQTSALHAAQTDRVAALLSGPPQDVPQQCARDILAKLPAEVVEQLRSLLAGTSGSIDPQSARSTSIKPFLDGKS